MPVMVDRAHRSVENYFLNLSVLEGQRMECAPWFPFHMHCMLRHLLFGLLVLLAAGVRGQCAAVDIPSLPVTGQPAGCHTSNLITAANIQGACGTASTLYLGGNEALHTLTPTLSGSHTITYAGQTWTSIWVYSSACPTQVGTVCVGSVSGSGSTQTLVLDLAAGVQYWIIFDTYPSPQSPCPGTFSISAPLPPGAACGTTVYDPGGALSNYSNGVDLTETYCPSDPGDVVTLDFTQFATEGCCDILTIHNGNSVGSPVIGTFSGTSLPGSFTSTDPSGCITLEFTSDGSITAAGWAAPVSCTDPPPPPAGDCVYILTLQDSFGDGWGSSSVGVSINGGTTQYYTVGVYTNQIIFGVDIGDLVVLDYNASGPWQGENSFTLTLSGGGSLYSSGPAPAGGIAYAAAVDCIPPPAPIEDCIGAMTICSDVSIGNNTTNTGSVADINPANSGCLDVTEYQGTWYVFSPSASGNLGFSINPLGPDDYDWAVWGPYPPGSSTNLTCPPSGPPIRCAASSGPATANSTGSYATGMGHTTFSPPQFASTATSYGIPSTTDFCPLVTPQRCGWVPGIQVISGQVYLMYISNWSQSSTGFTLDWTLQNGATLDCVVLPMDLGELAAVPNARSVDLVWATYSERGTDHFIVERSADGTTFLPSGTVAAQGESNARTDYRFVDGSPLHGMNFYRLVLVEQEGESRRSNVVSANFGRVDPVVVPNPVGDQAVLHVGSALTQEVTLRITDASGRLVHQVSISSDDVQHILDLEGLGQGAYMISLHGADGASLGYSRFVKR